MRTAQNILRHELTGLECCVLSSPNTCEEGISGIIIDESKRTLKIETGDGIKTLEKQYRILRVTLPDGVSVKIEASALLNSPTRRVNMRVMGGRN